jgi:hypothetical protein
MLRERIGVAVEPGVDEVGLRLAEFADFEIAGAGFDDESGLVGRVVLRAVEPGRKGSDDGPALRDGFGRAFAFCEVS